MKNWLRFLRDIIVVPLGLLMYWISGWSWQKAYLGMINLFAYTRGRSNSLISKIISTFTRRVKITQTAGVLGQLQDQNLEDINKRLLTDGYYLHDFPLDEAAVAHLLKLGMEQPCVLRGPPAQAVDRYPRGAPQGVRYDFDETLLINDPVVQSLMLDKSLLAVAQNYLGSAPIIDIVGLWWNAAHGREADAVAAQLFHFDMNRIKFLHLFIYITDVGEDQGPHVFAKGSHRIDGIPKELLRHGYQRLSDEDVQKHYGSDIIEFAGRKGTIIIEDTQGLHKGKKVNAGDRLLFHIVYANCRFGAVPATARLQGLPVDQQLTDADLRRILANYV